MKKNFGLYIIAAIVIYVMFFSGTEETTDLEPSSLPEFVYEPFWQEYDYNKTESIPGCLFIERASGVEIRYGYYYSDVILIKEFDSIELSGDSTYHLSSSDGASGDIIVEVIDKDTIIVDGYKYKRLNW